MKTEVIISYCDSGINGNDDALVVNFRSANRCDENGKPISFYSYQKPPGFGPMASGGMILSLRDLELQTSETGFDKSDLKVGQKFRLEITKIE